MLPAVERGEKAPTVVVLTRTAGRTLVAPPPPDHRGRTGPGGTRTPPATTPTSTRPGDGTGNPHPRTPGTHFDRIHGTPAPGGDTGELPASHGFELIESGTRTLTTDGRALTPETGNSAYFPLLPLGRRARLRQPGEQSTACTWRPGPHTRPHHPRTAPRSHLDRTAPRRARTATALLPPPPTGRHDPGDHTRTTGPPHDSPRPHHANPLEGWCHVSPGGTPPHATNPPTTTARTAHAPPPRQPPDTPSPSATPIHRPAHHPTTNRTWRRSQTVDNLSRAVPGPGRPSSPKPATTTERGAHPVTPTTATTAHPPGSPAHVARRPSRTAPRTGRPRPPRDPTRTTRPPRTTRRHTPSSAP
ncbi:hypothetical protein G443_000756 [Actinoalloteichus cyanogriseus DSM 43889]|uniref:Basic proline-rich protein n=1 Tax=Actinoalloteichus caeruleus DSM 43889 TaxID=1120930 RepID=A0ABT1JDB1_ACTCY|nr:hypothetical protein [Actinoalloteichus caeruleus DSM 43889]